eukprot:CAMPEP_0117686464 /NCGR_PEP_ID=MMETSP0804-20121206/22467_1 /TAXON_ID=1074897 /ORGANISM="Tetraselmis astigmatica, Strain CCMP880" /LENGTH=147 /DNA_ID=CAMNT_0005498165 /DNA_START=351 /DNA_END=791 /DNA_ORIENTATION=+
MARLLFEDVFEILRKDPDGKRFDRVSRFNARSDTYQMDLVLDLNVDIYPLEEGQKVKLVLSSTLSLDGSQTSDSYDPDLYLGKKPSLMDEYEYVMHGKIFKYKDTSVGGALKTEVFISYGGLLMQLVGDPKKLGELEVDSKVYLLIR